MFDFQLQNFFSFFFFRQMHTEKISNWSSLLFYLRVITEKYDVDGKVLQSKEPEEMMTIKDTGRVVLNSGKGMGLRNGQMGSK